MTSKDQSAFTTEPSFCPDCGSILPFLSNKGGVTCYACKREWDISVFGNLEMTYKLHFKNEFSYKSATKDDDEEDADGPIVERVCPQCKNEEMSYSTLQLRSADEGQTVFYTCTKCKFKETENS